MGTGPTAQRRRLGILLREMRNAAGKDGSAAGAAVDRSAAWVSHLEAGRVGIRPKMLDELLAFYGVTDDEMRREMHQLAVGGRERGWWSKYASVLSTQYSAYVGYENDATGLQIYETLIVHGLLQTPEYAEAVVRASRPGESSATIRKLVDVRLNRQRRLQGENPLQLMVVMDEAVLHRIIGGDVQVHLDQMTRLLDVARGEPHVRVQIIPFDHAMFPGMLSSFTIMGFARDPDIVYVETLTGDRYEDPPEADRYTVAFGDLRAAALSESASVELIEAAVDRAATKLKGAAHAHGLTVAEE
ncbi:transcriptional regulator [Actinocatenispora thailandica]|uniref:Transcriptional regulator n=1 Tax=Actinocatenispora thailandica TaxID=227318 RepID=A0A7R7DTR5_9ACTN|nr:helix-turn-helix transcriptional regulator [Actinocatenispora thailandica]BCJ37520.1 transcriptional regulator [Actinocatenispora thailandica]